MDQVSAKHRRYKLPCWKTVLPLGFDKDIVNSRNTKDFPKNTIAHNNMCVLRKSSLDTHIPFYYFTTFLFHQKIFHFYNICRHSGLSREQKDPLLPNTASNPFQFVWKSVLCSEVLLLDPACTAQLIPSYSTGSKLAEPHRTFVMQVTKAILRYK